jgi:hypothetical protein
VELKNSKPILLNNGEPKEKRRRHERATWGVAIGYLQKNLEELSFDNSGYLAIIKTLGFHDF